jgi:DNA-binding CsgD family transcriptional regulator
MSGNRIEHCPIDINSEPVDRTFTAFNTGSVPDLGPRERQVLEIWSTYHMRNSDLAKRLGLSVKTVESHKNNAFLKAKDCGIEPNWPAVLTILKRSGVLRDTFDVIPGMVVDSFTAQMLMDDILRKSVFSPKEREILDLIAQGKTNSQMAVETERSVKTIEKHKDNIRQQIGLPNIEYPVLGAQLRMSAVWNFTPASN